MALQGFGRRVRRAWHLWASRSDEAVTYADFGAALAKEEKRVEGPYSTSAISEWIAERSEPRISTFRAMATISGFRTSFLMLGELPEKDTHEPRTPREGAMIEPSPRPTPTPLGGQKSSARRRPGKDKSA